MSELKTLKDFKWKNGLAKTKEKELERIRKVSDGMKNKHNSPTTEIKKGQHLNTETEIKKGQHLNTETEFKKDQKAWNKGKSNYWCKGEKNPNWNNGSSFEPYGKEFNNKLREQIRKRDNCECQYCHKKQIQLKRKLDVHHIDYIKKNNSEINLISLCHKCHIKTNGNRKLWKRYFVMYQFIRILFIPQKIIKNQVRIYEKR